MKFVMLMILACFLSANAVAQTAGPATAKKTSIQKKHKTSRLNAKSFKKAADKPVTVTLRDEGTYKAKASFEEVLRRRLEIDTGEGELAKQEQKEQD